MLKQIRLENDFVVTFDTKDLNSIELGFASKIRLGKTRKYYNIGVFFKNANELTSFFIFEESTPLYTKVLKTYDRLIEFIYKSDAERFEVFNQ